MEVLELFNRIRSMWPKKVDISDGHRRGSSGYYFPALSSANSKVEERIDPVNDHWGNAASWAFFQAAHLKATQLRRRGGRTLNVDSIPVALFDSCMKDNLQGEGWAQERKEYKGFQRWP